MSRFEKFSREIAWLLDRQFKLAMVVAVVTVLLSLRQLSAVVAIAGVVAASMALIYAGTRVADGETSENWLDWSLSTEIARIVGGLILLFGWSLLLRGAVAPAVALWLG